MKTKSLETETVAVFRTFIGRTGGDTYALFPEIPADSNPAHCMSYARIGQHGAAYAGAIHGTRPATPEEYAPLVAELAILGYSLNIRRKVTSAMDQTRRKALKP